MLVMLMVVLSRHDVVITVLFFGLSHIHILQFFVLFIDVGIPTVIEAILAVTLATARQFTTEVSLQLTKRPRVIVLRRWRGQRHVTGIKHVIGGRKRLRLSLRRRLIRMVVMLEVTDVTVTMFMGCRYHVNNTRI